ncbi:hypothetical protein [Vibrio sp. D431a]|uniref:hypothetical protein n=1 Tax=Vibrio sp. D431a TaxID=2837388 RepID=UPI00255330C1|nr:hypothetical protein [Vibrio sp. D431a]MDK9790599.1 hypothetical protein [Vibrio sp. D431a]
MKFLSKLKAGAVALALSPMSAMAADKKGFGGIIQTINENLGYLTEFFSLALILFGMYCIYQLVMTFMNRDENSRDYPMKNVPFYFIGAALGLGAMAFSKTVQETLFGSAEGTSGADQNIWQTKNSGGS